MNETILRDLRTIHERVAVEGPWITPVREALDGVGVAEAVWKPGPNERSIWEIVLHMNAWSEWVVAFLQGRDSAVTDWPPVTQTAADDWNAAREQLDATLRAFGEQIAATAPEALGVAPTPDVTDTNRFVGISSILVHNAYHAGQITKLRERWIVGSTESVERP